MRSREIGRVVGALATAVVLAGASDLLAQGIVPNPGFTGGLAPWVATPAAGYSVGWDGAQGSAAAGALSYDWPSAVGTSEIYVASQCFPAAASTLYDVAGSFRYAGSSTIVPRGGLVIQTFADAACTTSAGGPTSGFGLSFGGTPGDTWATTSYSKGYETTATTAAMRVLLRVTSFATGASSGWFDDILVVPSSFAYHTVTPCRLVDTRDMGAPIGGPALGGQETRTFAASGSCSIPSTARSLSFNVTATASTSAGNLRLFPSGQPVPTISTINYAAGQSRANNGIVALTFPGNTFSVFASQPVGTSVHLIVDVNGYFE